MREIKCDICGEKIFDENTMTKIYFEFTDNNFHCDLDKEQRELNYECCNNCAYEFNDFNWYEKGDIISIGDSNVRYYCLIKNKEDVATKVRFAAEELYKLNGGK